MDFNMSQSLGTQGGLSPAVDAMKNSVEARLQAKRALTSVITWSGSSRQRAGTPQVLSDISDAWKRHAEGPHRRFLDAELSIINLAVSLQHFLFLPSTTFYR